MRKFLSIFITALMIALLVNCSSHSKTVNSIPLDVLKDKIAGGWAGKMIGVTYGAPTEFRAMAKIFEDSINWKPVDIKGSIWQDDLYVQLSFLMAMDKYGISAPARKLQEIFAKAGFPLWHANVQSRKNYFDSIFPPASGSPANNLHADDIDFQIEADYIGFMCPGMPQTACRIADSIGHIMNYGDGVYGGIFVGALYTQAFFSNNIQMLIGTALKSIPAESEYAQAIRDVIRLHQHFPDDWHSAWKELEAKWGSTHICSAGSPFNIDAKLNGAYIVMGLLYGDGDPMKTMEITVRCGQDSDCNPSNAMAVLGVMKGFSKLPPEFQSAVKSIADSVFINTNYSFNRAVESTYSYALNLIRQNGGEITESRANINIQQPIAPMLEVSFPNLVFNKKISVFEKNAWQEKGNWQIFRIPQNHNSFRDQAKWSDKAGDEIQIKFNGTGISLVGNWLKDCGKADIYMDGKFMRTIDCWYNHFGQEHSEMDLWHMLNLQAGEHTLKLVVKGEKRHESLGAKIYISDVTIFRSLPKKNEGFRFSFEK